MIEIALFASLLARSPDCSLALDRLQARVVANYGGYHLEVKGARRADYDRTVSRLARKATTAVQAGGDDKKH